MNTNCNPINPDEQKPSGLVYALGFIMLPLIVLVLIFVFWAVGQQETRDVPGDRVQHHPSAIAHILGYDVVKDKCVFELRGWDEAKQWHCDGEFAAIPHIGTHDTELKRSIVLSVGFGIEFLTLLLLGFLAGKPFVRSMNRWVEAERRRLELEALAAEADPERWEQYTVTPGTIATDPPSDS